MNWSQFRTNVVSLMTIDKLTTFGVIFLTLTSFILSYDAIRQLAVASGVNGSLSWLYPLSVDAVAIVAAVTVLRMTKAGDNPAYPWVVTVLFAIVSIGFNILHYDSGAAWYASIVTPLAYTVHSIPPIAVMLGFHLLILQKENDIRRQRATEGDIATDTPTDKMDTTVTVTDTIATLTDTSDNGRHFKLPRDYETWSRADKATFRRHSLSDSLKEMSDSDAADLFGVTARTIQRDRINGMTKQTP